MPATEAELRQVKDYARALVQLVEAIEAREKVPAPSGAGSAYPAPRLITRS